MNLNRNTLGIVLLAVAAAWWAAGRESASPVPPDAPDRPADALAALVEPVGSRVEDAATRRRLAAFYRDWADVVERDTAGLIATTGTFRVAHGRALALAFQQTDVEQLPADLGAAIDRAIGQHVGIVDANGQYTNVAIDAERRKKLVESLRALSWAFSNP